MNGLGVILTQFGCMSVVCVCAALPAGPGLPGGPANGCMKKDHAGNWNITYAHCWLKNVPGHCLTWSPQLCVLLQKHLTG